MAISFSKSSNTINFLFRDRRAAVMLLLGVSAGIPILLIFSSLSLWLREAGIERSAVTFFSWAALAYSFKFIWAPIVGHLSIFKLSQLIGQRRSWLLLSQLMIVVAISTMAMVDPAKSGNVLLLMALAAILLGFSSATQDIVIDAYRIEIADKNYQAMLSALYIAGYRIGMIIAGAGALYLAGYFGSSIDNYQYVAWQKTYLLMASTMVIGLIAMWIAKEPIHAESVIKGFNTISGYLQFFIFFIIAVTTFIGVFYFSGRIFTSMQPHLQSILMNKNFTQIVFSAFQLSLSLVSVYCIFNLFVFFKWVSKPFVVESYFAPIADFFKRFSTKEVVLILLLISLYRISDIVLGVVSNLFYQDLGFSKSEIASVVKVFGVVMSLLGGFLGGLLAIKWGVVKTLFLGALLSALTNLLFMLLANLGPNLPLFYAVISADNLAGGIASAAFVAYLSSLVNLTFTASQYAIFSSIMTLFPKILGGYSGSLVESIGYENFFLLSCLLGLPVLLIIHLVKKADII